MTFKKFCDYGGYFYGWICSLCGEIMDEIPVNLHRHEQGWYENKNVRNPYLLTWRYGMERRWPV
jgi:hypothetical protein